MYEKKYLCSNTSGARISDQVQKFASNIEFLYFRLYNIALSTETYSINQDTEILYLMPISVLDNKF